MTKKRLHKSKKNKVLAGVCSGVADYFNMDPVFLRILWIILVCCFGVGAVAYLFLWLIMPDS